MTPKKQNQFTATVRKGVCTVCRKLGYSTQHCHMVLNGKRESLPFVLLLDKHFPDLLDTATFDAKSVVKGAKKMYEFKPDGKYGKFVRKEAFDNRFSKGE